MTVDRRLLGYSLERLVQTLADGTHSAGHEDRRQSQAMEYEE
jgi:hypothetical protein